jgi:hypothetical protein
MAIEMCLTARWRRSCRNAYRTVWRVTVYGTLSPAMPLVAMAQAGSSQTDSVSVSAAVSERDLSVSTAHLEALVATAGHIESHVRFVHGSVIGPLEFQIDSVRLTACVLRLRTTATPAKSPSRTVTEADLSTLNPDSIRVGQYLRSEQSPNFVFDPPWWQIIARGRSIPASVVITREPGGVAEHLSNLVLYARSSGDAKTIADLLKGEIARCRIRR